MIDLDIIRDNYASMPDEKLILLAREDSHDLTDEALALLKQEFSKRRLDMSVFSITEQEETDEEEREPIEGSFNPATNTDTSIQGLAYQEMMYPTDKEKEKQLSENKEAFLAKLTTEDIYSLIKKHEASMIKNTIVFVIGFSVTMISFMAAGNEGSRRQIWCG